LTSSSEIKSTVSDLQKSVKEDALKMAGLKTANKLLVGGCVVTFGIGLGVGAFAAYVLTR
jgi:hypothetical protein